MNIITLQPTDCSWVRDRLDAHLDKELSGRTADAVSTHLDACDACAAELGARRTLKAAVRRAAGADCAPDELRQRILDQVRATAPEPMPAPRWWLAAAAAVVLAAGAVVVIRETNAVPVVDERAAVPRAEAADAPILRVGLGDHVHCALGRTYADVAASPEAMRAALGPEYAGLVDAVIQRIPNGYRIVEAHACKFEGRRFIHFICRSGDITLSVVVTRKQGETFDPAGAVAPTDDSYPSLHRANVDGIEVDGIETRDHLAFVVSGLSREQNIAIAAGVMPALREYLATLEA